MSLATILGRGAAPTTTTSTDGADAVAARRRELRREMESLDGAEHPLREQQRASEMLDALQSERRGVEARLRSIARLADEERVPSAFVAPWTWPRADEERRRLGRQLGDIDAQITRLRSQE